MYVQINTKKVRFVSNSINGNFQRENHEQHCSALGLPPLTARNRNHGFELYGFAVRLKFVSLQFYENVFAFVANYFKNYSYFMQ